MSSYNDNKGFVRNDDGDGVDYGDMFRTNEIFPSYKDALAWARNVALQIGFELVTSSHKSNNPSDYRVYFRCARGMPTTPSMESGRMSVDSRSSRPDTMTQKCDCPFMISAKYNVYLDGWNLLPPKNPNAGVHNHRFIVYEYGHRQKSGLSQPAKEAVEQFTKAKLPPNKILAAINKVFGREKPTINQVYNERMKIKRKESGGRTSVQQFVHYAVDKGYIKWLEKKPGSKVLTHAFLAHPESVELLRTYPFVIGIDATYKTNRYDLPLVEIIGMTCTNKNFVAALAIIPDEKAISYRWVLQKLKLLLGQVQPYVILTDRELSLFEPISKLFRNSTHMLCLWHINRDVQQRVVKECKDESFANTFMYRHWYRLTEAGSEELYLKGLLSMKQSFGWKPSLINYVEDTWLKHKEKFVKAWTNKVMHFGNVTTCRVESSHSTLKSWLSTCTASLDTVLENIDSHINVQIVNIKHSLEESISKTGRLNMIDAFHYLNGQVSRHCLSLLRIELQRMEELGNTIFYECGCIYRSIYGLPCACELQQVVSRREWIPLHSIHVFWRTLVIGSPATDEANPYSASGTSDADPHSATGTDDEKDVDRLNELFDDLKTRDKAYVREVVQILEEKRSGYRDDVIEPEVVRNRRGRPRKNKSTKRERNEPEYADCGEGPSKKSKSTSKSEKSNEYFETTNVPNVPTASIQVDFSKTNVFMYANQMPSIVLSWMTGFLDVENDGNCGFRVAADAFHYHQDNWPQVRLAILSEIDNHPHIYEAVYDTIGETLDKTRERINWMWTNQVAPRSHWMITPVDLFPIANYYNCVVVLFGTYKGGRSVLPCTTVLPWSCMDGISAPFGELYYGWVNQNHYIRLFLTPDIPLPPINRMWNRIRTADVAHWDGAYEERNAMWRNLYN